MGENKALVQGATEKACTQIQAVASGHVAPSDEAIEVAAKAIFASWHDGPSTLKRGRRWCWENAPENTREGFRRDAYAAILAYLSTVRADG